MWVKTQVRTQSLTEHSNLEITSRPLTEVKRTEDRLQPSPYMHNLSLLSAPPSMCAAAGRVFNSSLLGKIPGNAWEENGRRKDLFLRMHTHNICKIKVLNFHACVLV